MADFSPIQVKVVSEHGDRIYNVTPHYAADCPFANDRIITHAVCVHVIDERASDD